MTVRRGPGTIKMLPVVRALDPDEGFLHDAALTVGVHMALNVKVLFRL